METQNTTAPPVCGRSDCRAPATIRVAMTSPSGKTWVNVHCSAEDHGIPEFVTNQLGFTIDAVDDLASVVDVPLLVLPMRDEKPVTA